MHGTIYGKIFIVGIENKHSRENLCGRSFFPIASRLPYTAKLLRGETFAENDCSWKMFAVAASFNNECIWHYLS